MLDFGTLTTSGRNRPSALGNLTRGIVIGGTSSLTSMDAFTTSSGGNAVDYGNLIDARGEAAGGCTHTRGIAAGGSTSGSPSGTNSIEFISMQSFGNAQDFGDLATTKGGFINCCSDSHGGLGGY